MHLEAEPIAEVAQRAHVTGIAVAEARVDTDHDGRRLQTASEGVTHEVLGRLLGELGGEVEDEQPVDPRRLEQVLAQPAGRQQIRRLVRPQDRDRVRLEGDRDRREAVGSADAARLVDDGQVPTVHPVEIAEGHHTGLEALGCLGDVGPAMHAGESTNSRG